MIKIKAKFGFKVRVMYEVRVKTECDESSVAETNSVNLRKIKEKVNRTRILYNLVFLNICFELDKVSQIWVKQ